LTGAQCDTGGGADTFTDPRDGKTYRFVTIGTQTWMAENLNFDTTGSECYNYAEDNCAKYGRLYDWATVMGFEQRCNTRSCTGQIQSNHRGICPAGWHVPSDAEWTALTNFVGSISAGTRLKSVTGWNTDSDYIPGTDEFGFSALPGGYAGGYGNDGSFIRVGYYGFWWSATEFGATGARPRGMSNFVEGVDEHSYGKTDQFSLRCLRD